MHNMATYMTEEGERLYQEALDNYESWGQWLVECYTQLELQTRINEEGYDGVKQSAILIEEQHQEARSAGGLNDGEW